MTAINSSLEHERALIVDFGSQVTQLIARRLRESGVYCEVHPYNRATADFVKDYGPKAIILSGSPHSTSWEDSPKADPYIFQAGVPVLGICYGETDHVRPAWRGGGGWKPPTIASLAAPTSRSYWKARFWRGWAGSVTPSASG